MPEKYKQIDQANSSNTSRLEHWHRGNEENTNQRISGNGKSGLNNQELQMQLNKAEYRRYRRWKRESQDLKTR